MKILITKKNLRKEILCRKTKEEKIDYLSNMRELVRNNRHKMINEVHWENLLKLIERYLLLILRNKKLWIEDIEEYKPPAITLEKFMK